MQWGEKPVTDMLLGSVQPLYAYMNGDVVWNRPIPDGYGYGLLVQEGASGRGGNNLSVPKFGLMQPTPTPRLDQFIVIDAGGVTVLRAEGGVQYSDVVNLGVDIEGHTKITAVWNGIKGQYEVTDGTLWTFFGNNLNAWLGVNYTNEDAVAGLPVTLGLLGQYDFGDILTLTIADDHVKNMTPVDPAGYLLEADNGVGPLYDAANARASSEADGTELRNTVVTYPNGRAWSIFSVVEGYNLTDGGFASTSNGLGTATSSHAGGAADQGWMSFQQAGAGGGLNVFGSVETPYGSGFDFTKKAVYGITFGDLEGSAVDVYGQGQQFAGTRIADGLAPNTSIYLAKGRRSGASEHWMYEHVIYDRKLSDAEAQQVITYLNDKHGIV